LGKRYRNLEGFPFCFWCNRQTTLVRGFGDSPPDGATVDHLYSRLHPKRFVDSSKVLACYACNQERGRAECVGYVFVPKREDRLEIALESSAIVVGLVRPREASPALLLPRRVPKNKDLARIYHSIRMVNEFFGEQHAK